LKEVRPIEEWLLEVEYQMRNSLANSVSQSLKAYDKVAKQDWIFDWSQQVILVID